MITIIIIYCTGCYGDTEIRLNLWKGHEMKEMRCFGAASRLLHNPDLK
jgi:hypothetical protein